VTRSSLFSLFPLSYLGSAPSVQFRELALGQRIALVDPKEGIPLAILTIETLWKANKAKEAVQGNGNYNPQISRLAQISKPISDWSVV